MINQNISDLFFNTDVSSCKLTDSKGQFTEFDPTKLGDEGVQFLNCLERLGVTVPSLQELLDDFYKRV